MHGIGGKGAAKQIDGAQYTAFAPIEKAADNAGKGKAYHISVGMTAD